MALADWYELRHVMSFASGKEANLVWHFRREVGTLTAIDLTFDYGANLLTDMRAMQSDAVTHVKTVAQSLGNPLDFDERSLGGLTGTVTTSQGPDFVAFKLQFLRKRTDMKHGWKRIPGVPESGVSNNTLNAGYLTALQDFGNTVVAGFDDGGSPAQPLWTYGVIKRICYQTDSSGKCTAYRLPENDAELEFYIPDSAVGHELVASQVSRKA